MKDLVVIGGGVGGLVTASVAGQLGLAVTLIERGPKLGGDCLHSGCIPSKTLLRSAEVAALMRRAEAFGLTGVQPQVNMRLVSARIQSVIDRIQAHDDPQRFRAYGVQVLFGAARFINPGEVDVKGTRIAGRRFVIATGSRPMVPPVPGLEQTGYITNEQAFGLEVLPRRLAVLGAGAVGVELAQGFLRLGSRVCLLESAAEILPQEEPDIAAELRAILTAEGMDIRVGACLQRVEPSPTGKRLFLQQDEQRIALEVDEILVATGRRPNIEELALEAAGVAYDRTGIRVDARMRTSRSTIYACGDVCGPFGFTHMAEYQAGIVISNAVFRFPKKADYSVVPSVIYCDPELARVGLTASEAKAQELDVEVLEFPFSEVDRALTEGVAAGRMRLIVRRGRIRGATLLGAHAGELLHEIVLAMTAGVRIDRISAAIHAYPTLAQIHRRTVNTFYARKLFSPRTRHLVRWLQRLLP
ncbi:MAG: FAD-dependent oxidoreductase [Nitrococcus sp.]|nr:FAD-dependent oxidoreductase [Nitrococcus sp.]